MSMIILNQTDTQKTYVSGQIVLPASGQVAVSDGLIPYVALDPNFINDINFTNVIISDGVNQYFNKDAQNYISNWILGSPPQNSNDPITFTLAGKGFSVTGSATLNNGTETAVLLLTNPIDSGINARAIYFYAAPNSTQGIVTINIYSNPIISNNGTPITISNNLVSNSSPDSGSLAYGGPTISSNGTKRITMVTNANADTSLFNFAQTAILAPGNSMLMTVSVGNIGLLASVTTYFYLQWVEV